MLERIAGTRVTDRRSARHICRSASCIRCGRKTDALNIKKMIMQGKVPFCRMCEGLQKPDITFFGERLNRSVDKLMENDFKDRDLLIVAGTSLQVQPFAKLIEAVPLSCPRLLLNKKAVGVEEMNDNEDSLTRGFKFGRKSNYRDVFVKGNVDDTVSKLAKNAWLGGRSMDAPE